MRFFHSTTILVVLLVVAAGISQSQTKPALPEFSKRISTLGDPDYSLFNINRISTNFRQTGLSDFDAGQVGLHGLTYPKGSGRSAIFCSGLMWGALCGASRELRCGGFWENAGSLYPGAVVPGVGPEDYDLPRVHVYRVRPDIAPGIRDADIQSEIADGEGTPDEIYERYHRDWLEWRWQDGAPYDDRDGNGIYDPAVDVPGVKGADQTLWYVANDLRADLPAINWYSAPLGLEMQGTIWGYDRDDPLGNVVFRRYVLINRGTETLDSMFVSLNVDPDLGHHLDDLVGCDTLRSLGFIYNAYESDKRYTPLPPPSIGFDFLQGPVVPGGPGDSAIVGGRWVRSKRNVPMTAFYAFDYSVPDPAFNDPWWGPNMAAEYYNLLNGKTKFGDPWIDPSGNVTRFPFSGDPYNRTGWLDGQLFPPGDRRLGLASGPFTMAAGDTQEIVIAVVAAGAEEGVDRLSAVELMKYYDDFAQQSYNYFFDLPTAPPPPTVLSAAMDEHVILSWGEDQTAVQQTENFNKKGYAFQGYNVYMLPSASSGLSEGKLIATYDIIDGVGKILDLVFNPSAGGVIIGPVQYGSDCGIKREIVIDSDPFKDGTRLLNGSPYYFCVTSYAYNSDPQAAPRALENPVKVIAATPHTPDPGTRYGSSYGDTVKNVNHTTISGLPPSGGSVVPEVIDPTRTSGGTYQVVFDTANGADVWHLLRTDGSTADTLARNQTDQTGDPVLAPVVDGIRWRVYGVTPGFKTFEVIANAAGSVDPPDIGCFAFNESGFPFVVNDRYPSGTDRPTAGVQQSTNSSLWGIHTGGINDDYTYEGRFLPRTVRISPWSGTSDWDRVVPWDFEIRFTASGGKGLMAFTSGTVVDVPFELWNTGPGTPNDPSDDFRMIPWINDEDGNEAFNLMAMDHTVSGGDNDPYTDWIYWMEPDPKTPGTAGYDAFVADPNTGTGDEAMARMVLVNWNGGSVSDTTFPLNVNAMMPETRTVFRITSTKPNSPDDVFTIVAPAVTYDQETAKADLSAVNVFPNPYYGVNPLERDKYYKFVTFSHLPERATIRIFNLGGIMVRKIDKSSTSQFQEWDLKNEGGLLVGSGLYIVHIEATDLGVSKILKLAIVQEEQVLDKY